VHPKNVLLASVVHGIICLFNFKFRSNDLFPVKRPFSKNFFRSNDFFRSNGVRKCIKFLLQRNLFNKTRKTQGLTSLRRNLYIPYPRDVRFENFVYAVLFLDLNDCAKVPLDLFYGKIH
jgi:hypothetical protein